MTRNVRISSNKYFFGIFANAGVWTSSSDLGSKDWGVVADIIERGVAGSLLNWESFVKGKRVHNNNNRHFNTWANPELKLLKRERERNWIIQMKLNLFDFFKSILFSIKGCVSYFLNDTLRFFFQNWILRRKKYISSFKFFFQDF